MKSAQSFFLTYMIVFALILAGIVYLTDNPSQANLVRNNLLEVVKLQDPIILEENFRKVAEGSHEENTCENGEDVVYLLDEFNNIYIVERLYGEVNQIRISEIPILYSEWNTLESVPWFVLYYETTDTNMDGVVTKQIIYKIEACNDGGVKVSPVLR